MKRVCESKRVMNRGVYESGSSRKEKCKGEKQSAQENAECVQPQASGKQAREKKNRERKERVTLSLEKLLSVCTQIVVNVYLLCTFQISLFPIENPDPALRLNANS